MKKILFNILLALLLTPSLVLAGDFRGFDLWVLILAIAVQFLPIVGIVLLAVAIVFYFIDKNKYRGAAIKFGILSAVCFVIYGLYYFLIII